MCSFFLLSVSVSALSVLFRFLCVFFSYTFGKWSFFAFCQLNGITSQFMEITFLMARQCNKWNINKCRIVDYSNSTVKEWMRMRVRDKGREIKKDRTVNGKHSLKYKLQHVWWWHSSKLMTNETAHSKAQTTKYIHTSILTLTHVSSSRILYQQNISTHICTCSFQFYSLQHFESNRNVLQIESSFNTQTDTHTHTAPRDECAPFLHSFVNEWNG